MADKIDTLAFGIALSLTWTILITALGLFATLLGQGTEAVETIATLYIGYEATLTGTAIGSSWALIDGLLIGLIFATIYNKTTELLQKHLYLEKEIEENQKENKESREKEE